MKDNSCTRKWHCCIESIKVLIQETDSSELTNDNNRERNFLQVIRIFTEEMYSYPRDLNLIAKLAQHPSK